MQVLEYFLIQSFYLKVTFTWLCPPLGFGEIWCLLCDHWDRNFVLKREFHISAFSFSSWFWLSSRARGLQNLFLKRENMKSLEWEVGFDLLSWPTWTPSCWAPTWAASSGTELPKSVAAEQKPKEKLSADPAAHLLGGFMDLIFLGA